MFNYSCLHLPPTTPPPHPSHPHLPPLLPPYLGFVHLSFIVVPENPSPLSSHYPLLPPLWLLSVSLFLISMYGLIFCLLVCFAD